MLINVPVFEHPLSKCTFTPFLYLYREAAELEAWISEKEAVAASEDIGRDLEHVEVRMYIFLLVHTYNYQLIYEPDAVIAKEI